MQKLDKYKTLFIFTLLLAMQSIHTKINAQNLVKNPSFEDYELCPSEFGCLEKSVPSWYQPTEGSSDYFNACSPEMSTEDNFIGLQSPFDGQGYAGFYAYAQKDYREYLTAELQVPLKRGRKYVFSFQVSLAEESQFGVNEFGILFTHKAMEFHTKRNIPVNLMTRKPNYNYTIVRNHKYFDDKEQWIEVTGVYIADGTEKFMTIGNFNDNSKTRLEKTEGVHKKIAYYYVDMVAVEALDGDFTADEMYVLSDLLFDLDGYEIQQIAKEQLENLVSYLKAHRGYTVTIYGHTDNIGSRIYNKELSAKRAKSVAEFLIENGLESNRILWRGYGDSNPLALNKTEEGRRKNRRVEFMLSRKKKDYYASSAFEEDN